jgi:hypothetical protein
MGMKEKKWNLVDSKNVIFSPKFQIWWIGTWVDKVVTK